MEQIVRSIVRWNKEIPSMNNIIETRGNLDFINILNSYPEFVEGKEKFVLSRAGKSRPGRKTDTPSPDEVEYLVYLVESLYLKKEKEYTRDDRRKLKDLINRAVDGADFFDTVKSKHWIDMFSSLEHCLHFFSKSENAKFLDFFGNYISFYSKLNNKKTVPFYARWITEISAMYCVYLGETIEEFESIRTRLQNAHEEGRRDATTTRRLAHSGTDYIRNQVIDIFVAHGKNKDIVIEKLCEYIKENPIEFAVESGRLNSRYRRYYCTIKEMLEYISKKEIFDFASKELIDIFTSDDFDYEIKDANVRALEAALVNRLLSLNGGTESDALEFFVRERAKFDEATHSVIVYEIDEIPFEKPRTIEEVVDCVVKLLRLVIILISTYSALCDDTNEYEIPSSEEIIKEINQKLGTFDLLPLPEHSVSSYNSKSLMDLCVIKFIEENFYEDE